MRYLLQRKLSLFLIAGLITVLFIGSGWYFSFAPAKTAESKDADYIKWVDFNVPYEALDYSLKLHIESRNSEIPLDWIELLAYLAAENGNNFRNFKTGQIDSVVDKLRDGKTMEMLAQDMKYYDYYHEAYTAILSGLVGDYEIEVPDETSPTGKRWERKYGLKAFCPIAKNYYYSHYYDFGAGRSYGFFRRHLGHDMIGSVGTPVVAVEGGIIEAMGWNQYGGWRIGIRSYDRKRYYYYAHLRKDFPFHKSLSVGSVVKPGDVIGYLGRTGYSRTENVNNIRQAHLHIGLQLIFHESQKDSPNEIWIDVYQLMRLLSRNRCEVEKDPETKDYYRVYDIREIPESYIE
ncbi:MAG TPA: M23 family metallopeptidase [Bacillota bacterium]|jgi:murein DD-endopeptidase MepM/ murein hydrolase activator NlpD|nr:M23 family metallopeptidase [Bacillota bacterium]